MKDPAGLEPAPLMLTYKFVEICSTPLTTAPRRLTHSCTFLGRSRKYTDDLFVTLRVQSLGQVIKSFYRPYNIRPTSFVSCGASDSNSKNCSDNFFIICAFFFLQLLFRNFRSSFVFNGLDFSFLVYSKVLLPFLRILFAFQSSSGLL